MLLREKFKGSALRSGGGIILSLAGVSLISILLSIIFDAHKPAVYNHSDIPDRRWFRGNTHTHTKPLDYFPSKRIPVIASWYKNAGYDFLVITDHNTHDSKDRNVVCHNEVADPPDFIMLCGLELSNSRHITGLGIDRYIGNEKSLQDGVDQVIEADGVPILNHPMFPPVKATQFIATRGLNHLEVFNGKRPKDTRRSEMLWDSVLSSPGGRLVYAVAADDNHHKKRKTGLGWIMVESPSLTPENIENNIRKGNFYASTGIFLKDFRTNRNEIMIESENGTRVTFIGRWGKVLNSVKGPGAVYKPTGNEHYIRIKITDDDGQAAWTQPFFLN